MKHSKIGGVAQKIISTVFFLATFACLFYFFYSTKYLPFFLASIIVAMPVAVNILLHLFACKIPFEKPQRVAQEEGTKKGKKILSTVLYAVKLCAYAIAFAYNKTQKILQIIFAIGAFAGFQILFGVMLMKLTSLYNPYSFIHPIVLVLLFVVAIIIDKWIKHSEPENDRTAAFFHNTRVFFYITRLALVLLSIAMVIKLLNFGELQKYLYYALIAIFYYASVLMLISLVVSFIKKELTAKPKIVIPLPFAGKDKNDLSILSFLENNTGITMRSLWSIKLMKQIIPYTVIAVAALFWLSTGIVQVESYQEAAVYRLGVLQSETLQPGIHLTLPAPFDRVEYYDTQKVNKVSIGYVAKEDTDNLWTGTHGSNEHKLLLGNGNELVSLNLKIEYKIKDLHTYLTTSSSPASILEARAYDLITQRVIVTDLETLLAVDRGEFTASFEKDLEAELEKHDIGVEVVSVVMESIHPPLEIASIYQGVIGAEIQAEEIIKKAENSATVTLTNAEAKKNTAINNATAESHSKIAAATSSVSEFMASVEANNSNKDAYQYYKYLDALTQAYGKTNLILVGDGVDTSKIYFGNISNGTVLPNTSGSSAATNPNT